MRVMNNKLRPSSVRLTILLTTFCVGSLTAVCYWEVGSWNRAVRQSNEVFLEKNLEVFRQGIRRYAVEKQQLPQSVDDLIKQRYAPNLPDPVTGRVDWQVAIGEDSTLINGKRGVTDVHSASTMISSRGTPYCSW